MTKTYESWRNDTLYARLHIGRIIGIAGMVFFVVLDSLAHPGESQTLLLYRVLSVALMLSTGILDRTTYGKRNAQVVLLLMVWALTFPMIHMSAVLGGYASSYYLGVILIHCGAVAIFPLSLRIHLLAQAGTFLYYYGLTSFLFGMKDFLPYGIETIFFHIWFFGLLDLAVFYYERIARERYIANQEIELSHAELQAKDQMRTNYFLIRNEALRTLLDSALHRVEDGEIQAQKDKLSQYQSMFNATRKPIVRLRSEIIDFLDLAELESGKMKFDLHNFDLVSLINGILIDYEQDLVANKIVTNTSFAAKSVIIRSDPVRLKQVISFLLEKLIQEASRGKIIISVNLGANREGPSLMIMMSADGVGMAPEQRVRVFLPFHLTDDSSSGTRLPIARMMARKLGGDVTVSGDLGHGTTFTIEVPIETLSNVSLD